MINSNYTKLTRAAPFFMAMKNLSKIWSKLPPKDVILMKDYRLAPIIL